MNPKLKLSIITLIVFVIVAYVAYNHFGNRQRRQFNSQIAKLGRMVNEDWRWYQAEAGKIAGQMDESQRGKLTIILNRELRKRLDRIGSFKHEIETSYKQLQAMPGTYRSIDETIQKMKKQAETGQ